MKKYLSDYCVGCGLCEALSKAKCEIDENGFWHPISGDEKWLDIVCPSGGKQCDDLSKINIWGKSEKVYYGWSNNNDVRKMASSGGVLTEIASWALESGYADAVIHTCVNSDYPTKTEWCVSHTRQELIDRSGSRYAISHPLSSFKSIDKNKRYVFIGKPCDITALHNFMKSDTEFEKNIVLTLSFFCAGLPSQAAQIKLLEHLKCPSDDIRSLRYRGDGWPGWTTAVDKKGKVYRTDYATSWGAILGRDIMKMCRVCLDGIGELADISCGDAWYLKPDKKPDFTEAEGRNVIFARTLKGKGILEKIVADKKIVVQETTTDDLRYIQTYQWERKATMSDKLLAMKLLNRTVPNYKAKNVMAYFKVVGLRKHYRIFKGTLKRIKQGKI